MEKKYQDLIKKYAVFVGLTLLCAVSLWFIFAPSAEDKTKEQQGLNKDLPSATTEQLTESKLKDYELGAHKEQEDATREKMGRLSDYMDAQTEESESEAQANAATAAKVEHSMQRYAQNKRLLSSFYEPDYSDNQTAALQAEIDALKAQLASKDEDQDEEDKQLALMEKSYQMAARYLPQNGTAQLPNGTTTSASPSPSMELEKTQEEAAFEVLPERKQVVSSLSALPSDSAFIVDYGIKARNLGFHGMDKAAPLQQLRNTLRVVVEQTTTLKEGDFVVLRLLEAANIRGLKLPRQTRLMAQAKIAGKRLHLTLKSIEHAGRIIPVKLIAYDLDGQEGLHVPALEELSAIKEVGAGIGGTMGTSFTFASSAKDQILSEAARGVMQGAAQLLQKKLRSVKVTLKSGHRLYLISTK